MKDGGDSDDFQQDPAERFREGIENAGAASAPEGQANGKIEFGLPLNTEQIPLRRMNGDDFEGIGNVRFGEPSSVP